MRTIRNSAAVLIGSLFAWLPMPAWAVPPYPPSTAIPSVTFDFSTHILQASDSDNWPITWAADDNQYTSWGDGGGFRGDTGRCRVSLGFARIEGTYSEYEANPDAHSFNVWGCHPDATTCDGIPLDRCAAENPATFEGKSYGMISVGGTLYAWWGPLSGSRFTTETRVAKSTDLSQTWSLSSWAFTDADELYAPTFLNFGKENAEARDGYVYSYFPRGRGWSYKYPGLVDLARVPADQIMDQSAYSWYTGTNSNGDPTWSDQLGDRVPVFEDANGFRVVSVTYNPGLGRYLLAVHHGQGTPESNLGIFEAPEPWGPWRTVTYLENWGVAELGRQQTGLLAAYFAPKWFSADGRDFTLVYTDGDHWATVRGRFSASGNDTTPPSAPGNLRSTGVTETTASLSWDAASDSESGIQSYRVYRDGGLIDVVSGLSATDSGLSENTLYDYYVTAINGAGLEGPPSNTLPVTTASDTTAPTISDARADSSGSAVDVSFSEPVSVASAEDPTNYHIDGGVSISSATLAADDVTVTLSVSSLTDGTTYTLTVNDVEDRASVPNVILPDSTRQFTFNPEPTTGMLAHWQVDGNADDATGAHHGVVVGPEVYDTGVSNEALLFDGTHVNVSRGGSLDDLGTFTYTAWIYPHTSGDRVIISKDGSVREFRLAGTDASLHLRGCVVATGDNACSDSLDGAVALTTWQHMAMTFDENGDGRVHLFIDGIEVQYSSQSVAGGPAAADASSDLNIGRRTSGDRDFDGAIDEVRIYDRVLTDEEIATLAGADPGDPVAPPAPTQLRRTDVIP